MDSETASSLIYGVCAEIAAGNGTATAKLGDVHDVEPPEGWTPLSEAAAFTVVHQVVRRLWTNARPLADVAVDVALRVYHREVAVNRESANRCKALGYSADAGCHLRSLRRHVAATRCLSAYPTVWEHVRQLLVDDDAETWEARAAAVADAHYPGWRDMPFIRERSKRHSDHYALRGVP